LRLFAGDTLAVHFGRGLVAQAAKATLTRQEPDASLIVTWLSPLLV
jgi:hypothetical protein